MGFCWENGYHGVMADDAEYAMFNPPRLLSAHTLKMSFQYDVTTIEYVLDEAAKLLDLGCGWIIQYHTFDHPLPLSILIHVPFDAGVLYRPRHGCNGKAGRDGRLANPVERTATRQTVLPKPLHTVYEDVVATLAVADL